MLKLRKSSLDKAVATMKRLGEQGRIGAIDGVQRGGKHLAKKVRDNMSYADHTLEDLRRLDHPYADRHPGIQIHKGPTADLRDGTAAIHKHTGTLLASIEDRPVDGTRGHTYRIEANENKADYAKRVLGGTEIMHPRNVFLETAEAPGVKKDIVNGVTEAIIAAIAKV